MVLVVLFMCENGPDINSSAIKVDDDYQPELVPADVKNDELSNFIDSSKGFP